MPFRLCSDCFVENISVLIEETAFNLLTPQPYSQAEVEGLKQTRYGLVRRFQCELQDRPSEDEKSAAELYKLYLGLKILHPTRGRFQVLHYSVSDSAPRLPRGSKNDFATIVCDWEGLNYIRWTDVCELARLASSLIATLSDHRNPISQAVHNLEIGYRADFLNVRHLLWVIGLDALFTSTERENQGKEVAIKRISDFLGSDFQIYSADAVSELSTPIPTQVKLTAALGDCYRLRNDFAHGTWPDKAWAGTVSRRSADGARNVYYAEVLSEAACSILRGCLKRILSETDLVKMFSDKQKMNMHFAARGLVRRQRSGRLPSPAGP